MTLHIKGSSNARRQQSGQPRRRCCLRPAQSSKSHVLRASCSCRGRAARSGRRRQCHAGAAQSVRVRRRRLRWCAAWPSLRHRHRADASRPRRRRGGVGAPLDPLLFECSLVGPPPSSKGPRPLAFDPGRRWARRRSWTPAASPPASWSLSLAPAPAPAPGPALRFRFPLQSVVLVVVGCRLCVEVVEASRLGSCLKTFRRSL